MTRLTLKQLRSSKGEKWAKLDAELAKMVEGSTTDVKMAAGSATVYKATPGKTVATGLTSITGFSTGVISPVTPANAIAVNATPIGGNLIMSVTPADAVVSWIAYGA